MESTDAHADPVGKSNTYKNADSDQLAHPDSDPDGNPHRDSHPNGPVQPPLPAHHDQKALGVVGAMRTHKKSPPLVTEGGLAC